MALAIGQMIFAFNLVTRFFFFCERPLNWSEASSSRLLYRSLVYSWSVYQPSVSLDSPDRKITNTFHHSWSLHRTEVFQDWCLTEVSYRCVLLKSGSTFHSRFQVTSSSRFYLRKSANSQIWRSSAVLRADYSVDYSVSITHWCKVLVTVKQLPGKSLLVNAGRPRRQGDQFII